jgi:hypothetical protein
MSGHGMPKQLHLAGLWPLLMPGGTLSALQLLGIY